MLHVTRGVKESVTYRHIWQWGARSQAQPFYYLVHEHACQRISTVSDQCESMQINMQINIQITTSTRLSWGFRTQSQDHEEKMLQQEK